MTSDEAPRSRKDPWVSEIRELQSQLSAAYPGDEFPLERALACASLARASKIMLQRLDTLLSPFEISPAQYDIIGLLHVAPDGQLAISELRRRMCLHSATMTHTIDGLERAGLAERRRDLRDRRAVILEITPHGRSVATAATAAMRTIAFGLAELDDRDVKQLAEILSRIEASPGG